MKTIILTRTNKIGEGPDQWTEYTNKETGKTISIQAGKQPWTWNTKTNCPILEKNPKLVRMVLEKYVEQGIKQHDYKGGFEEATSELVIKYCFATK